MDEVVVHLARQVLRIGAGIEEPRLHLGPAKDDVVVHPVRQVLRIGARVDELQLNFGPAKDDAVVLLKRQQTPQRSSQS